MCPRYFYLLFLTLSLILLLLVLWLISAFVTPSTSSFVMLISVSCQGWISHTTTIVLDQVCVLVSTMPCTQAIHEFNSWASLFFFPNQICQLSFSSQVGPPQNMSTEWWISTTEFPYWFRLSFVSLRTVSFVVLSLHNILFMFLKTKSPLPICVSQQLFNIVVSHE